MNVFRLGSSEHHRACTSTVWEIDSKRTEQDNGFGFWVLGGCFWASRYLVSQRVEDEARVLHVFLITNQSLLDLIPTKRHACQVSHAHSKRASRNAKRQIRCVCSENSHVSAVEDCTALDATPAADIAQHAPRQMLKPATLRQCWTTDRMRSFTGKSALHIARAEAES
eukprot:976716-Rhodomonas_salina.1